VSYIIREINKKKNKSKTDNDQGHETKYGKEKNASWLDFEMTKEKNGKE